MRKKPTNITLSPEAEESLKSNAAGAGFRELDQCVDYLFTEVLNAIRKAKEKDLAIVLVTSEGAYAGSIGLPKANTVPLSLHAINIPSGASLLNSIKRIDPKVPAQLNH